MNILLSWQAEVWPPISRSAFVILFFSSLFPVAQSYRHLLIPSKDVGDEMHIREEGSNSEWESLSSEQNGTKDHH